MGCFSYYLDIMRKWGYLVLYHYFTTTTTSNITTTTTTTERRSEAALPIQGLSHIAWLNFSSLSALEPSERMDGSISVWWNPRPSLKHPKNNSQWALKIGRNVHLGRTVGFREGKCWKIVSSQSALRCYFMQVLQDV